MLHGLLMCAVLILHAQTQNVCEPEAEVEAEALAEEDTVIEAEAEVAITEEPEVEAEAPEAEVAAEEAVIETVVESVEQAVTEAPEAEQVTEVSPAAPEEEDAEVEVLSEEEAPEVPAESVSMTEVQHCYKTFLFSLQHSFFIFFRGHKMIQTLHYSLLSFLNVILWSSLACRVQHVVWNSCYRCSLSFIYHSGVSLQMLVSILNKGEENVFLLFLIAHSSKERFLFLWLGYQAKSRASSMAILFT